jgi:hypothetical protein
MAMVNILLDSSHTQQCCPDSFTLSLFQQHYERMVLVHNPPGPQLVVPVNASEHTVHIPHGRPPCVFLITLLDIIRIRITYTGTRHSWATHDITTICLLQVEKCGGRLAVSGRDSILIVDEILFL